MPKKQRKEEEDSYMRERLAQAQKKAHVPAFAKHFSFLLPRFPRLKEELEKAGMNEHTPISFVYFALNSAVFLTLALLVITYFFMARSPLLIPVLIAGAPIYLLLTFIYSMQLPKVKAQVRARMIDSELLFAGRHLLIGIRAGVPLFEAMGAITRDYGEVSREFAKILEKISLGAPTNVAMYEVANQNPSQMFRRVIMQLTNSLSSGSDVGASLESVFEQISREQIISLHEYGQKLNPIVMFFMIFGVVFPSLGVALGVIFISFMGGGLAVDGFTLLGGAFVLIFLMQFMFVSMADSSRPKFQVV